MRGRFQLHADIRTKFQILAERVGFEPTVEFPLHTLSKRAPSTTRTSLRNGLHAVRHRLSQTLLHLCSFNIAFVFSHVANAPERAVAETVKDFAVSSDH